MQKIAIANMNLLLLLLVNKKEFFTAGFCATLPDATQARADRRPRGVYKLLRIHVGLAHFQFLISGIS